MADVFDLVARLSLDSSKYEQNLKDASSKAKQIGDKIGSALKLGAKVGAAAVAVAGTAVVKLAADATKSYAQYEQLVGGVDKLFGTGGQTLKEFAKTAKATASDIENSGIDWDKYANSAWMKEGGGVSGLFDEIKYNLEEVGTSAEELQKYLQSEYELDTEDAIKAVKAYQNAITDEGIKRKFDSQMRAQKTVLKNAQNAYKTAGMTANQYMETVTGFSAALITSLGGDTEKAAEKADQAIRDMSDNANTFGTAMDSIQNAYAGFSKGNFTMLDNLKLGYGGTKEEMERLLDKAEEISGFKYDLSSYADIVDAIHVVQTEMNITGTTQREAAQTISGSIEMTKAAWGNFLTAIAGGGDVKTAISNLVESASHVYENVLPVVQTAITNIGNAITEVTPLIVEKLPGLVADLLPNLIKTATDLVNGVIEALPGLLKGIIDTVGSLADSIGDTLDEKAPALGEAWDKITQIFKDGFDLVKGVWENTLLPIFEGIGTFFTDTVGQAISYAWNEVIIPIFSAAFTAIDSVWNNVLKPVFTGIYDLMTTKVIPFLSDAWNNTILPTIQTVFGAAKTAWETVLRPALVGIYNYVSTVLAPGFKRFFENVIEPAVSTAFDGIKWVWENVLKKVFEDIKNFIEDPIIPIIGTLGEKFTTFKDEVLTPVATFISETLSGAFTTLKNIWVNDVQPKLQDLYNALSGFKTEVLDVIDSFIRENFSKAFENLKGIWDGVKEALTPLKTSLDDFKKKTVEPIYTFISEKFSGAFKDVATFWDETLYPAIINVGGALKWVWENVFKKLAEYIGGGFTTAVNGIKTVFDGITTFLNDTFHVDWDNAWTNITSTFGQIIKGIEDVILTPINNVISAFQDLANTVRGIIDGIVDRASKAVSWVKSQFRQANQRYVDQAQSGGLVYPASYTGPRAPTIPILQRAGGGIVREGQRSLVGEAGMEYLSVINGNAYVSPIGGRQAKNLQSGGGTTNITFNVYAQPGQDAEQIARTVQREFVRWEQQRRAAFV